MAVVAVEGMGLVGEEMEVEVGWEIMVGTGKGWAVSGAELGRWMGMGGG